MKDMAEALEDEDLEDLGSQELSGDSNGSSDSNASGQMFENLKRIIGAEPPPKPVEEYKDHALNFDGSKSTGKIIKGMEGLLTNLDKAIIVLVIGLVEKYTEKQGEDSNPGKKGDLDARDPEH